MRAAQETDGCAALSRLVIIILPDGVYVPYLERNMQARTAHHAGGTIWSRRLPNRNLVWHVALTVLRMRK